METQKNNSKDSAEKTATGHAPAKAAVKNAPAPVMDGLNDDSDWRAQYPEYFNEKTVQPAIKPATKEKVADPQNSSQAAVPPADIAPPVNEIDLKKVAVEQKPAAVSIEEDLTKAKKANAIKQESKLSAELGKIEIRLQQQELLFGKRVQPATLERMKNESRYIAYERILLRYRGATDMDQQALLKGIRLEKQELAIKLGKATGIRKFFAELFSKKETEPIKKPAKLATGQKATQRVNKKKETLRPSPFISLLLKIDRKINRGSYKGTIHETRELSDGQRINYAIDYKMGMQGKGEIHKIQASVIHDAEPEHARIRTFNSSKNEQFSREQIEVLMTGGSIYREQLHPKAGSSAYQFISLDFNDKDQHGQFRFKETAAPEPQSMRRLIEDIPGIREQKTPEQVDQILARVTSGRPVEVSLKFEGKETNIFLLANSANNISVNDKNLKPLKLDANGPVPVKTAPKQEQTAKQKQTKRKTQGLKAA